MPNILTAAWKTLELRARHDPRVGAIIVDTIADHVREGYRVRAWCPSCARLVDVDLAALVRRGLGDVSFTRVVRAFRCRRCGEPGQIIRTPADRAYQWVRVPPVQGAPGSFSERPSWQT